MRWVQDEADGVTGPSLPPKDGRLRLPEPGQTRAEGLWPHWGRMGSGLLLPDSLRPSTVKAGEGSGVGGGEWGGSPRRGGAGPWSQGYFLRTLDSHIPGHSEDSVLLPSRPPGHGGRAVPGSELAAGSGDPAGRD